MVIISNAGENVIIFYLACSVLYTDILNTQQGGTRMIARQCTTCCWYRTRVGCLPPLLDPGPKVIIIRPTEPVVHPTPGAQGYLLTTMVFPTSTSLELSLIKRDQGDHILTRPAV